MTGQELTESQCYYEAQRTLHQAELIQRGAQFAVTGSLVLPSSLLEYVMLRDSGLGEECVDQSEPPTDHADLWLDTSLQEAWIAAFGTSVSATYRELMRHGFTTRRDLLTAGRVCVGDTRNVGKVLIGKLGTMLATNPDGPRWEDEPAAEYVATFCTRLSQVHAGALGLGLPARRATALDVLDTPLAERPFMFRPHAELRRLGAGSYVNSDYYAKTSNVPEVFAMRFERARTRSDEDLMGAYLDTHGM